MAKWAGNIGFVKQIETDPGIWEYDVTERKYIGNLTRNARRYQSSGNVNDNMTISNEISIIADPFAKDNSGHIKYVEFMGAKWKVTNIEVQYPRLNLTLGDVYNA